MRGGAAGLTQLLFFWSPVCPLDCVRLLPVLCTHPTTAPLDTHCTDPVPSSPCKQPAARSCRSSVCPALHTSLPARQSAHCCCWLTKARRISNESVD